jgi:hypothetical protein
MKRLFLIVSLTWCAIYAANHLLLPRLVSDGAVQTAQQAGQTTTEQATTGQATNRQIDSWGPFLPNSSRAGFDSSDEISIEEAREGETKKAPVVDPAAKLANQHASLNEAERSPLDNPGLPLRKPSSRDVSVAEQQPANRHVRPDPRRRAPVAEDGRVAQLERSVDVPHSRAKTPSLGLQEGEWPRRRTEGPRPGLGLFIFAPPGF